MERADYVILGNGVAGISAAEAIRSCSEGTILMVTEQRQGAYLRPLLSKADLCISREEDFIMCGREWEERTRVKILKEHTVETLDPGRHLVLTSGEAVEYGKCIYALGSRAFVPPIPGTDKKGVFSIRTLEDIMAVRRYALKAERAAVIGGGVIGMEISEVLHRYGLRVTVLEGLPYLMPRVLDRGSSEEYRKRLEGYYEVMTGIQVERLDGEESVRAVCLADGRRIPCELAIFSCGVRAVTDPAVRAGIETGRGVKVNRFMETNAPDVYACGDCAELEGTGSALWKPAMEQGKTAGLNACGLRTAYEPQADPVICNSVYVPLFAAGERPEKESACDADGRGPGEDCPEICTDRYEIKSDFMIMPHVRETYRRTIRRNGKLTGAVLIGNLSEMENLRKEIAGGE